MGWYRTKGNHTLNDQADSLHWCSLVSQLQSANNINKLCYSVEGKIDFNTKVTNPCFIKNLSKYTHLALNTSAFSSDNFEGLLNSSSKYSRILTTKKTWYVIFAISD